MRINLRFEGGCIFGPNGKAIGIYTKDANGTYWKYDMPGIGCFGASGPEANIGWVEDAAEQRFSEWIAGVMTPAHVLESLTDDQRLELFRQYCVHCGCDDPRCQCWNDA